MIRTSYSGVRPPYYYIMYLNGWIGTRLCRNSKRRSDRPDQRPTRYYYNNYYTRRMLDPVDRHDDTTKLLLLQLLSAPTTTIATTATVHTRVCALYYIHTIILLLYSIIIYTRARSYHYNRCEYTAERRIDTRPSAGFIRMWNERLLCEELLLRNEIYSFFFFQRGEWSVQSADLEMDSRLRPRTKMRLSIELHNIIYTYIYTHTHNTIYTHAQYTCVKNSYNSTR
jgi:hypothetical protein